MEFGLLTKHYIKKAEFELVEHQSNLRMHENKKVFETMMALAKLGELTPERYAFFMSVVSDQGIGDNDVQKYILNRSFEKRDR